jgi:hypothetical protein
LEVPLLEWPFANPSPRREPIAAAAPSAVPVALSLGSRRPRAIYWFIAQTQRDL